MWANDPQMRRLVAEKRRLIRRAYNNHARARAIMQNFAAATPDTGPVRLGGWIVAAFVRSPLVVWQERWALRVLLKRLLAAGGHRSAA